MRPRSYRELSALIIALGCASAVTAADLGRAPRFHVLEWKFRGPMVRPSDTPARDVVLNVTFRHESGKPALIVPGFWDGDGKGGSRGSVFKVRFCPEIVGRWTIAGVRSNRGEFRGQHAGDTFLCTKSKHPGGWIPDGRWYKRADGSHPMIVGNTHYTFLSRHGAKGRLKSDPVRDIRENAKYFKKLRFSLFGGRYPDPQVKPFLDDAGKPSDDGRFSFRPNPEWFHRRADPVIAEGRRQDLICDLILCGPDTAGSRATLLGDPQPWLRYVAARYGAYPNVWFCLCNEWNIKKPRYTAKQIRDAGRLLKASLAWPRPISVHSNWGPWNETLNGDWHDHVIIQHKLKTISRAADAAELSHRRGGRKPLVNDENAYEGRGDRFTFEDTVEGCLGTFLGGGYPTTGEKYGRKLGQYFWGGFDPKQHKAAVPLKTLREYVDRQMSLATLRPLPLKQSIFRDAPAEFRVLGNSRREYVLGSNREAKVAVDLPTGRWKIVQLDLLKNSTTVISKSASGRVTVATPASRAAVTHFRRLDEAKR
jgi:Domain of unknown function (DUF5060)/Protein of unknown function (DUF4038)